MTTSKCFETDCSSNYPIQSRRFDLVLQTELKLSQTIFKKMIKPDTLWD